MCRECRGDVKGRNYPLCDLLEGTSPAGGEGRGGGAGLKDLK